MQVDFVDPASPSRCAPVAQERLPAIRRLLDAARAAAIPVLFSQGLVAPDLSNVGLWKSPIHRSGGCPVEDTRGAEIVEELAPLATEAVVRKRRPSVFFGSDLDVSLRGHRVDTLIVCGSSMGAFAPPSPTPSRSTTERWSSASASSIGPSSCSERNLFDVDAKYADAVTLDETLAYLARFGAYDGTELTAGGREQDA
jgi:hypothetical protein